MKSLNETRIIQGVHAQPPPMAKVQNAAGIGVTSQYGGASQANAVHDSIPDSDSEYDHGTVRGKRVLVKKRVC